MPRRPIDRDVAGPQSLQGIARPGSKIRDDPPASRGERTGLRPPFRWGLRAWQQSGHRVPRSARRPNGYTIVRSGWDRAVATCRDAASEETLQ